MTYYCDKSSMKDLAGQKVADWNVLRRHLLEFATPCGHEGYARESGPPYCPATNWALCTGDDDTDCRGLNATDDCGSDVGSSKCSGVSSEPR